MKKATIGVDLRALVGSPSGIGFFTLSMLRQLAESGLGRYIGMAHRPVYGEDELKQDGVRCEYKSAPLGVLWQQLVVPRRLRQGDIDLFWSPLLTLPLGLDLPTVVTIHDLTPLLHPQTHSLKVRLSILPFLSRTVDEASCIVADSKATANDIRDRFPRCADRLHTIYPGVDPIFRPGDREQIAATRAELGFPAGYILFVGTLEPRKNIGMLLDAWESLRAEVPEAPGLVIAGGYGWRSKRLLQRIRNLEQTGDLKYLERIERDQLVRVYQAARVFTLPSIYEGFGLPAAEAMACGIPTVVTDSSSLPEVVGDAGITVTVDDSAALARELGRLWRDQEWSREVGQKGREQARLFSWKRSAVQMEQVFELALR